VGAWIETLILGYLMIRGLSRLPWARGLKHAHSRNIRQKIGSRLPWARGLKLLKVDEVTG